MPRFTIGVGCALLQRGFGVTLPDRHTSANSLLLSELEKVVFHQLGNHLEHLHQYGVFNRTILKVVEGMEHLESAPEVFGDPLRCQITLFFRDHDISFNDNDHTISFVQLDGSKEKKGKKGKKKVKASEVLSHAGKDVLFPDWLPEVSPLLSSCFEKVISLLLDGLNRLYHVSSVNLMFFAGGDVSSSIPRQAFHTDYDPKNIVDLYDGHLLLRPLLAVVSFSDLYQMVVFSKQHLAVPNTGCDFLESLIDSFGEEKTILCPFGSIMFFQSNCIHAGMGRDSNSKDHYIFRLHLYLEPVKSKSFAAVGDDGKDKYLTTYFLEKMK